MFPASEAALAAAMIFCALVTIAADRPAAANPIAVGTRRAVRCAERTAGRSAKALGTIDPARPTTEAGEAPCARRENLGRLFRGQVANHIVVAAVVLELDTHLCAL